MSHTATFRPVLRPRRITTVPRVRFAAGAMVVSALVLVTVFMILLYFSRMP